MQYNRESAIAALEKLDKTLARALDALAKASGDVVTAYDAVLALKNGDA